MTADMHTHVLPAVDDGSSDVTESLALLQLLKEQGIRHVVATPHFYPHRDTPGRFLQRRAEAEKMLRRAMAEHPDLPELHMGAEVYYYRGMGESDSIKTLTIDQKSCILIEMPESLWSDSMLRELEDLHRKQGLIPIIAHVDRYISPFHTHGIPERLQELPVLVQANAGFFLRPWTRGLALKLLRRGQIHLLGSDCHNLSHRPPCIGQARDLIRRKLGQEALDRIDSLSMSLLEG